MFDILAPFNEAFFDGVHRLRPRALRGFEDAAIALTLEREFARIVAPENARPYRSRIDHVASE